jgi:hypothetical protein
MLAGGLALIAWWAGGWHTELFGVTVSVRAVWRPLVIAAVFLVVPFLARDRLSRAAEFLDSAARVLAGALLVAGVLGWMTYLSPYLGGADSYGYVSASERVRAGELIQVEPLAAILPRESAAAATPLGYVAAARVANATAPAYPLGLPVLMAFASTLFGARAPFYVPLAMGVVLLASCYWIARRLRGDSTLALAAAAAVAIHPVVCAYAIQAMSDVPAAAWYLLAAALLMTERTPLTAIAGIAGCLTFLTRPALLPAVMALSLIAMASGAHRRVRVATFGAVLALGIAAQGWVQWYLYGSPLANGYGTTAELFSLRFLTTNVRSYVYWAAVIHGAIWIAAFAAGLFLVRDRSTRALLIAAFIGAAVPYAVYRPYDHWETLRFILPLLVIMTIFAVAGLFEVSRRVMPERVAPWVGLALTIVMAGGWARWLDREQVLALSRMEERFARAGELVARATPESAVILSSLHSGSLRYYAKRQTVDWLKIPPGQFDAAVDAIETRGHQVFVLVDGDEERSAFEQRHGTVIDQQRWLPSGQRRDIRLYAAPSPSTRLR